MKRLIIAATCGLLACNAPEAIDPPAREQNVSLMKERVPLAETNEQLAAARAATARYQNIERALGDGFKDINVFMPGMGHHFLNEERLDEKFEPGKPELLVYNLEKNGRYRLVAVEYAVPLALAESAPKGFDGQKDEWDRNTTFSLWTLHAWVWMNNPDGIFEPFNPRLF